MTWHNDIFEMHQRYGVHGWMETHRRDPEMMKKFLEFRVKFLEEELYETKKQWNLEILRKS